MQDLIAESGGLAAAAAGAGAQAVTVQSGAAAEAVPMTAVLPGTASPAVIAATARIVAHGTEKLAVSTAAAAFVGTVAAAFAENGIGYELADDASAASLAL